MIAVATVILSILWVMGAQREKRLALARADGAEQGARLAASQAVLNVRVVTLFFTEGPIEQRFYIQPDLAEREAQSIKPGDYAGDGRRVTSVSCYQPFKPHTKID